jgi:hypothetical protein
MDSNVPNIYSNIDSQDWTTEVGTLEPGRGGPVDTHSCDARHGTNDVTAHVDSATRPVSERDDRTTAVVGGEAAK